MKFTALESAWLDELGYLDAVNTMSPAEQKALKIRAQAASAKVTAQFANLHQAGELKEFNQGYKAYRLSTTKAMPYKSYVTAEQTRVIRSMAREQIYRAARGERVE